MTAFQSLTPSAALEFVEAAGVSDARRIIADFAAAGLIRSYALSIRTTERGGRVHESRGATVPAELWERIISEGVGEDVWLGGTVRLRADGIRSKPAVSITAVSFGPKHLQRLVDQLGGAAPSQATQAAPLAVAEVACKPTPAPLADPAPSPAKKSPSDPDLAAIPPGALTVTIKQAQAALGLGRTKINDLMNEGQLVRTNIGRAVRIEVSSIYALVGIDRRSLGQSAGD